MYDILYAVAMFTKRRHAGFQGLFESAYRLRDTAPGHLLMSKKWDVKGNTLDLARVARSERDAVGHRSLAGEQEHMVLATERQVADVASSDAASADGLCLWIEDVGDSGNAGNYDGQI